MASLSPNPSKELKKTPSKTNDTGMPPTNTDDVTIMWFDPYMNEIENKEDVDMTKGLLRKINDYTLFYSDPESCFDYVKSVPTEKIFLIISGAYAFAHLDKLHPLKQIDSVFIFCVYQDKYLPLKKKYSKIIDVFTEQNDLMASLTDNVDLVTKQARVFGLFDGKQRSTRYLKRESASFLWFQLLTDVIKNITLTDIRHTGIEEMLAHCRIYYRGNSVELNNIEEFRQKYKPEDAIMWYSKQSFVYRSVNKALRTEDIDALYTFRDYITHLRTRIAHEHSRLRRTCRHTKSSIIRLYRGLKMTMEEILQMRDNVGGLISMNGFFSTSRDLEQAVRFATKTSNRNEVVGVLLEIDGDVNLDKMIFADIVEYSAYPKEQEVLFDLASIFKIVHVEFDKGRNLWIMQLTGVEKSAYTVSEYIKGMGKETEETSSTLLFGRVMCDMGEYEKSEKYLTRVLSSLPNNHPDIPKIYFHLGRVSYLRGEYKESLLHYEHALQLQKLEIKPKEESFDIAQTLDNIGNIYLYQKQTTKALEYYQKALEMKRSVLHDNPNHASIATTLSAIGSVYKRQGNLTKALELYQQSYEMKKLSLPTDHPSIADSLNLLGTIYQETDDYEQALECYKKSLKIKQQTLPPTHTSLSDTLNNMGIIYRKEGDYNKALICYTQALQIEQTSLSPDNLDIAHTYSNLCALYFDQSQYEKALQMAQLKLNILKKHYNEDDEQIKLARNTIEVLNEELNEYLNIEKKADHNPDVYL